jgi:hypothetical protein
VSWHYTPVFASSLMLTPRCARGQPLAVQNRSRRFCVRIIPDAHPSLCSGPAFGCPKSLQAILLITLPPLQVRSERVHPRIRAVRCGRAAFAERRQLGAMARGHALATASRR